MAGSRLYVYFISLVAATSGLLFGFDIAVINGALVFLRQQWGLSEFETEIAASALLVGCILGAGVGGWISDRLGRRVALMICAVLFTVSAIWAAVPHTLIEFTMARFVGGAGIGAASMLAPIYIAEVAPARIRGRLVALNQMTIVTGILLSYLANWGLSHLGPDSWRWMFAVAAVPSVFFFVTLWFVPESPRWLTERGREDEARRVLARVNGSVEAELELDRIRVAVNEETGTLRELFQPGVRRAFVIAIVLAVLQQWTGINTVLFYGSVILKERVAGQSANAALAANVLVGAINFLSTWVAIALIDKIGRRVLLMFSSGAMLICLIAMAAVFSTPNPPAMLVVPLMLVYVATFAVGLGPGVWVVMAEIFPNRIRGRAMGLATLALWAACTVLTLTFLSITTALGPSGAFSIYAVMCLINFLFVWKVTPETRGKSLEEIELLWKKP